MKMRKLKFVLLAVMLLVILCGCQCKHEWTDATCTSPQKCIECNITNGQPISHSWSSATCQSPKQCPVCGTIEGEVIPHTWTEATCSQPKTCTMCGATDGDKLSHMPTEEWVAQKTDYIYAETVKVQTCTSCGEVVNREITDIEEFHDGTFFLISPEEFTTRLDNTFDSYTNNDYSAKGGTTDGSYACGIIEGSETIGVLMFTKNDDTVTKNERDDSCAFNKMLGLCDMDAVARIACALMQTADPTISLDDAKEYAQEMLEFESVSVNGVKYIAMISSDEVIIGLTIE